LNGEELRDAGHAGVLAHVGVTTADALYRAIGETMELKAEFTSEDVLELLDPPTREALAKAPNALGALIRAAARLGYIVPTGRFVKATRREAHARRIAVWRKKSQPTP